MLECMGVKVLSDIDCINGQVYHIDWGNVTPLDSYTN